MIGQLNDARTWFRSQAAKVKDHIDYVELNNALDAYCLVLNNIGADESRHVVLMEHNGEKRNDIRKQAATVKDRIDIIEMNESIDAMFVVLSPFGPNMALAWMSLELAYIDSLMTG